MRACKISQFDVAMAAVPIVGDRVWCPNQYNTESSADGKSTTPALLITRMEHSVYACTPLSEWANAIIMICTRRMSLPRFSSILLSQPIYRVFTPLKCHTWPNLQMLPNFVSHISKSRALLPKMQHNNGFASRISSLSGVKVAVLYQATPPPLINGARKPAKPGGKRG